MREFIVHIAREGSFFVARCPSLDVTSQGDSMEEARENIREAIAAYLDAFGEELAREEGPAAQPFWTTVAV